MEKETPLTGEESSYDFGARIYNPVIGRFFSVDDYYWESPSTSPYSYAINSPIIFIDKNGDYAVYVHYIITRAILERAGISKSTSRLIAHYASVVADSPSDNVTIFNQYMGHRHAHRYN